MEKEDEILEKLKTLADKDIEIPALLQPDKIRERLCEVDNKLNNKKRRRSIKNWLLGMTVAVGAVAAAFAIMINSGNLNPEEMAIDVLTSVTDIVAGKKKEIKKKKKNIKKKKGNKKIKKY